MTGHLSYLVDNEDKFQRSDGKLIFFGLSLCVCVRLEMIQSKGQNIESFKNS